MKDKKRKNTNKGYMTLEASLIVPMVLCAIFMILFCLIFVYERGVVLSSENEALYTIPVKSIRDDSVTSYLSGRNYEEGITYGSCDVNVDYVSHKAKCEGMIHLYGDSGISSKREIDVCVDRLRRWQLYDDIAEK
ncbi:MAG: hypothetical protein J5684_04815 [Eubacterium sp.]|nr:hypothetical protein [Eubacterium sp.]